MTGFFALVVLVGMFRLLLIFEKPLLLASLFAGLNFFCVCIFLAFGQISGDMGLVVYSFFGNCFDCSRSLYGNGINKCKIGCKIKLVNS